MDQTTTEVRSEINRAKADLGEKLETLEDRFDRMTDRASSLLDFKQHAQDRPWMVVGIAAGAGFLLGRSRMRIPLAAIAALAWKAIPTGLGAFVMQSLRDEANE